jgi:hypothetical protein
MFAAVVPLWVLASDALYPSFFYYTGGCVVQELSQLALLRYDLGGALLVLAALPVMLAQVVFAGLVTASAARRIAARFRRPRGPIPGAGSRRAATVTVTIALGSLPVFAIAILYAGRADPNPALFRGLACLPIAMALLGGALVASARRARGYRRWGLLLAACLASTAPRTLLLWTWTHVLMSRMPRREHMIGARWTRLWGSDVSMVALTALVVLSVIAAWPRLSAFSARRS